MEDEARALPEEVQNFFDEAQARASAMEQNIFGRFDEYMQTWTEDRGRPQNMADVAEQRHEDPQFDNRLLLDMAQQAGWLGPTNPKEYWTK